MTGPVRGPEAQQVPCTWLVSGNGNEAWRPLCVNLTDASSCDEASDPRDLLEQSSGTSVQDEDVETALSSETGAPLAPWTRVSLQEKGRAVLESLAKVSERGARKSSWPTSSSGRGKFSNNRVGRRKGTESGKALGRFSV
eukprot:CAMPEP_0168378768 /NCGR_PEP_ID=MMETSP0228-20121227/11503_1 /TAXON_ID=133427 /ORGANISM="Protoceratium reticulatum, Strain CCCM 535 (=CCMP 1889)" /LENGTH=139 /DNA_ID=CAMNT_0008391789 /DNA_START=36 /DNA_END=455 /DNA_ORIENTATION=+